MNRMFTYNGGRMVTWNPFTGCNFSCSYCWARKLAEGKLKKSYPDGFIPAIHPDRFNKRFKPDDFVFISSMGDISLSSDEDFSRVLTRTLDFPKTNFLFCSKDPKNYGRIGIRVPNIYLGTTIETTEDYHLSKAPSPYDRFLALSKFPYHRFISIEPIMDFDLFQLLDWLEILKPDIVEVGADNYHNHLPEPSSQKLESLLYHLKHICPTVIEKQGLERLKRG